MSDHSSTPSPSPDAKPASGGNSDRFFGWLRSLGIARGNGWIGGVCGGIAARLGIDPLIVRGIAVVIAVLGGPALLVYAAAWLMLPDRQGEIHLERLIRGHFEPAMVGIIVIALFAFLPFSQGFWWTGAQFWTGFSWFATLGRALWGLLIIGLIVAFIVWAVRNGRVPPASPQQAYGPAGGSRAGYGTAQNSWSAPAPTNGAAATDAAAAAGAAATAGTAAGHFASSTSLTDAGGGATDSGSADAAPASTQQGAPQGTTDMADWRARQDAWRADYAAWTAQQEDARAIREQRSAELRAQAAVLTAEADEARRRRRAANPRTSAAYVFIVLGLALIGGGVAGAVALAGSGAAYALPIGIAGAAAVTGVGIVTAGILRRRSGFLSFVSIVLVLLAIGTALPPRGGGLVWPAVSYTDDASVHIYQPVGATQLRYESTGSYVADVTQSAGEVTVLVTGDVTARITVVQHTPGSDIDAYTVPIGGNGSNSLQASNSDPSTGTHTYVLGDGPAQANVHIDQGAGNVTIRYLPASN
ncbi:PspC domain-containing protein [Planctomonas sp. JC2975]|uniref:PspC domain-containing protein n=1 Tax=Planctomonas sp. JC2975 TaxID=2729626 RepID=UPI001474B593|nr:PspC domain-containing protein [Planctomonas sp. JC2975]NNC13958.1 PspC domain-containing protein [Planctomonas sp. JC2975]